MAYNADDVIAYMTRLVNMEVNDSNAEYICTEGQRLNMWLFMLSQAYKTFPPKDLEKLKLTEEKLQTIKEGEELLKQNLLRYMMNKFGLILSGED